MTQSIYFPLFQLLFFVLSPILAAVLCLIINRQRIGTKQMPELKAKENLTKLMIDLIISAAVVAAGLLLEKFRHELFGGAMEQALLLLTNASSLLKSNKLSACPICVIFHLFRNNFCAKATRKRFHYYR